MEYVVLLDVRDAWKPLVEGGVGGRPVEGRRCVSLATGAAASLGLRNIENRGACRGMDGLNILRNLLDSPLISLQ